MLEHVKEFTSTFINSFSNISLNSSLIIFIATIFIVLHNLRRFPIIKNISVFVSFFPVLVHEMGHAFAANILGGKVTDIHMILSPKKQQKTGQQGYAITGSKSKLSSILVVFSGYIAAPLLLFIGTFLIENNLSFIFVIINIYISIFYLLNTKQKWIPLLIIIILIFVCYHIWGSSSPLTDSLINTVYNILLGLLLGETLQSIITTTKVNFKDRNNDWDGAILKSLTHIPATIWWLTWAIFSIFSIYQSFILFNN